MPRERPRQRPRKVLFMKKKVRPTKFYALETVEKPPERPQSRFRDAQTKPTETERSPDHSERPERKEQKGAERPGSSKAGSKHECVESGTTQTNKAPNGLTLQLCTKK